jgi:hypothetical protein
MGLRDREADVRALVARILVTWANHTPAALVDSTWAIAGCPTNTVPAAKAPGKGKAHKATGARDEGVEHVGCDGVCDGLRHVLRACDCSSCVWHSERPSATVFLPTGDGCFHAMLCTCVI